MRKIKLILSCLFLTVMICGCSKKTLDTFADVSNGAQALNTNKGDVLTVGQVYNYIRENSDEEISKNILKQVMRSQLDFSNQDMLNLYKKYLNEYFKMTFVDSDSYKYYENFDEMLVVSYLKSEMYDIKCGENYNSGLLDNEYFTCDYSDYIEKEVEYDIYLKMLKIKYILDEKANLIDKNYARRISYYSATRSSSTDYATREKLEGYVSDIEKNYASTDESLIKNIEDIAEINRKEDLTDISEEFEKVSVDDTSFTYLNKYTTCGNVRCTLEEGKEYQEKLVMDKEYYVSKVVVKSDESVLYEAAREILFSKKLSNYLYKIGDKNYLMSPAYGSQDNKNINDIILFDNSSTYYIVTVDIIDNNSSFADKVLVAELLLDSISNSDILSYCFDKVEMEIYDKQIREYFEKTYGEIRG